MNINFTLVLQSIHFLIAYVIIDRFLLRPVMSLVQEDEDAVTLAQDQLKKAELQLHKKEKFKNTQWNNFCAFFRQTSPPIQPPVYKEKGIKGIQLEEKLTPQQKQALASTLTDAIISGVSHGI